MTMSNYSLYSIYFLPYLKGMKVFTHSYSFSVYEEKCILSRSSFFFCGCYYMKMTLDPSWLWTWKEHEWQTENEKHSKHQRMNGGENKWGQKWEGEEDRGTQAFSTSGYGQKENAFQISMNLKLKINVVQSLCIFVYTSHSTVLLQKCLQSPSVWENS